MNIRKILWDSEGKFAIKIGVKLIDMYRSPFVKEDLSWITDISTDILNFTKTKCSVTPCNHWWR